MLELDHEFVCLFAQEHELRYLTALTILYECERVMCNCTRVSTFK